MRSHPVDPIVVDDLRGGRNDTDSPMKLPVTQATEFLNCDWKDTTFAHKRGGATAVSQSGGTAWGSGMQTLERHVPGNSETAAELWGIDGAGTPIWKRLTGGTTWADVTVDDAVSSRPQDIVGVALNGKRFFAYDSSVDRLHVYDPTLASPRVRRVGFATPGAPTAANQGVGTYAATLRYYRVRWLQMSGTTIIRRSEPGASVSFTPNGTSEFARVTRPTAPGEGETHWEIEVSTDDAVWSWRVGASAEDNPGNQIAIATTTFDDGRVTANFPDGGSADSEAGLYGRFPSVKFLMTDGNRLLGGGAWEASGADSSGKNSRIWLTPVLGSADAGDDERVPNTESQKNYVDLNENDGGAFTGCGGPLNGLPWWFKYRQVWRLLPTGDVTTPYLPRKMRDDIGCISHKTIAIGEDQLGRAALYFLSHRGPYRITLEGDIQYLGRDNEVTWRSMNLAATNCVACSVYYPDLHQWWLWIATGSENDPDVKMVFDVQKGFPDEHGQIRGGWYKHTGGSAVARSAVLFSNTLGATMSRDLKPYISRASGVAIWKLDTTDLDDAGTDFQAYIKTRPMLTTTDLGQKVGMAEPFVLAKALTGVTLTLTTDRDFGAETRTHTALLTASGTETRVVKKFEGGDIGEADAIQVQIGDGAAQEGAWSIDALVVPVLPQERK